MARRVDPDTFVQLRRGGVVVDVRTPAEFASGHIPGAHNIPLFSDAQRAEVGTIYKRVGRDEAVHRGLEFVGPRMAAMVTEAGRLSGGREILLYCWRGGMRSGSVGWLLETAGLRVVLLEGGYKAYRHSFEELLDRHKWDFRMLYGATGCGKTELLQRIGALGGQVLDLEGLACHKGSAFGGLGQQRQPSTEHFINLLHESFRGFDPLRPVWCEGESILVGHVYIPNTLFDLLHSGAIIGIDMPLEQRLDRLVAEYGGFPAQQLSEAFGRIAKRMGREQVAEALSALGRGDIRAAARLALEYYDKAYARSFDKKSTGHFTVDNSDMDGAARRLYELYGKV